mmetsp:Transcript_41645/g.37035  ORF Transcript_41645/g.37035 Transcript_41645/m.37035 type:complete len:258 (+) Transcript_41645:466-1239(+)
MVESLIKPLSVLQSRSIVHGDIKPSTVFISRMGVYKIAEHNILGNEMPSYYQRMSGFEGIRTYLSPALMTNLEIGELKPAHNPWKSDVFSLALTFLHAATLSSCDHIYNWSNFTIDFNRLNHQLEFVKNKYSPKFYEFLKILLSKEEHERPDFLQIEKMIESKDFKQAKIIQRRLIQQKTETQKTMSKLETIRETLKSKEIDETEYENQETYASRRSKEEEPNNFNNTQNTQIGRELIVNEPTQQESSDDVLKKILP